MTLHDEYFQALEFAGKIHAKQKRGNGDPYIFHCVRVSQILAMTPLPADMTPLRHKLIHAGILHDCIEDCDKNVAAFVEAEIIRIFGSFVAGIVKEVTQDRSLETAPRRKKMVDECGAESLHAQILKLADRLDNCSEMNGMSEKFILRYLEETPVMLRNMEAGCLACPSLKQRIEAIINPMIAERKYERT